MGNSPFVSPWLHSLVNEERNNCRNESKLLTYDGVVIDTHDRRRTCDRVVDVDTLISKPRTHWSLRNMPESVFLQTFLDISWGVLGSAI